MGNKTLRACRVGGVALVSAIFLLVVLAALGTYMLSFTNVQHSTSALDIEGTRAYWAAKSGADLAAYRMLRTTTWCNCSAGACDGTATATTQTASTSIGNFTVTYSCRCVPTCEANTAGQVSRITANACNQASGGVCPNANSTSEMYVNRQVTAVVPK